MAKAKKLPSGSWRALVYVGKDQNGKRQYESFTADTKVDAEYLAAQHMKEHPGYRQRNDLTLGEAFDSYIDAKSSVLSPSTLREYRMTRRNHFQSLMNTPIDRIKARDVQIAVNKIAATKSPKTVRNLHGTLSAVLKMFRPDFVLTTTFPEKQKHEIFIPERETMKRIIRQAEGRRVEIPLLLAVTAGLRASEINGLTYGCIDCKKCEITIKQASVRGDDGNVLKQPKSYAGYRTIPCSSRVLDKIGDGDPDAFVLGKTSNYIDRLWMRYLKSIHEEYFNFHALRHYFCSQALLLGVPKKYIAELMGHSSENMIDKVYAHTFKNEKAEFAQKIVSASDDLFG